MPTTEKTIEQAWAELQSVPAYVEREKRLAQKYRGCLGYRCFVEHGCFGLITRTRLTTGGVIMATVVLDNEEVVDRRIGDLEILEEEGEHA